MTYTEDSYTDLDMPPPSAKKWGWAALFGGPVLFGLGVVLMLISSMMDLGGPSFLNKALGLTGMLSVVGAITLVLTSAIMIIVERFQSAK